MGAPAILSDHCIQGGVTEHNAKFRAGGGSAAAAVERPDPDNGPPAAGKSMGPAASGQKAPALHGRMPLRAMAERPGTSSLSLPLTASG